MGGCGMKHLTFDSGQLNYIKAHLAATHLAIEIFKNENIFRDSVGDSRRNRDTRIGNTIELLIYLTMIQRYNPILVKFDMDKIEWQRHNHADGKVDNGYDIGLNTLTHKNRIDCKYDRYLSNGKVVLGLFNSYGYKHLLLSGKATHSCHVFIEYKQLSPVQKKMNTLCQNTNKKTIREYVISIVWVDLEKLSKDLIISNDKYGIGPYKENLTGYQNRVLELDVDWLVKHDYAVFQKVEI